MLWWMLIALAPTVCDSLTSVNGRSYEIAFSSYACCQPAAQMRGATSALGCANTCDSYCLLYTSPSPRDS